MIHIVTRLFVVAIAALAIFAVAAAVQPTEDSRHWGHSATEDSRHWGHSATEKSRHWG